MKDEYDVDVEWRAFLLDPTTPPEGRPYPYPPEVRRQRGAHIREMATAAGLPMADRDWISNSRPALEAAEFARDHGKFDAFHRALFVAYFAEGCDIGKLEVLQDIARNIGLDADEMTEALADGRYADQVNADLQLAARIGVQGVPFFIIGNRAISGAQPYEVFEQVMEMLGREKRSS